ncbi:hypothetical protein IAT40_003449 [Kwoniella sp. CBS 6097]
MDASIKGDNIRTFIRLLQCAAKYGDDLNIHATPKVWEMSATNSSKSAFCLFKLDKSFFCRWDPKTRKGVKCRLLVKSVLAVLGKTSQITTVNRVDLRIIDPSDDLRPPQHQKKGGRGRREMSTTGSHAGDDGGERSEDERRFGDEDDWEESDDARVGIEAKLIMRLVCKHGVTKKHSLHLASSDFLRANVDPDTTPSGFVISTRTLRDWLDHFSIVSSSGYGSVGQSSSSGGTNQLGWMFTHEEVRVKSWEAMGGGGLTTEIKVDVQEFQDYEITDQRIDLTLPMKEFKATLVLAEQLSATLNISFSEPGQPLTLTSLESEFEDFSIFCAIATTVCEAFIDVRGPGPQIDIKRSSSGLARSRNASQATSNGAGTGDSNSRAESPAFKRRSSEVSSQSRKRSTLSLTSNSSDDHDRHNINSHAGPNYAPQRRDSQAAQTNSNNQHLISQGYADVDMGGDNQPQEEGLFFPGGSQRDQFPMSQALPHGMSQQDIDDLTGNLNDDDLDLDLNEDEAAHQAVQGPSEPGTHASQQGSQTPGPHGHDEEQAEGHGSEHGGNAIAGPSVPRRRSNDVDSHCNAIDDKGKGGDKAMSQAKGSDQTKSSAKSRPSRVSNSNEGDTTSTEHGNQSEFLWGLEDDHGIPTGQGAGDRAPDHRAGDFAAVAEEGDADVSMNEHEAELGGEEEAGVEVDELDEDEDQIDPTQPQGVSAGGAQFTSLFED